MTETAPARGSGLAWALVLTAVLAPWPFASVEPRWRAAFTAVLGVLGVLFLLRVDAVGARRLLGRRSLALAAGLPLVALLQLVPLPASVAGLLSPGGIGLLRDVTPDPSPAWLPLSLDPEATKAAVGLAAVSSVIALAVAVRSAATRRPLLLPTLFVVGGSLLAIFGLAQRLYDPQPQRMFWSIEIYEVGTPFGPYVNRNHFGGAMILFSGVAAGATAALFATRRRIAGASMAVILTLLLVALLATTSRGALLGMISATAAFVSLGGRFRRRARVLPVVVVGAIVLAGLAGVGLLDDLLGRLTERQGRWTNRFAVQLDAMRVFFGQPLSGTGAGTFPTVYSAFQSVDDDRYFRDAHSDWAQYVMETGLLGVGLVGSLGASLAAATRRLRARVGPRAWLARGALAALAGIVVHGLFETNLHIPANALLTAVVVGIAFGASVGSDEIELVSSRERPEDDGIVSGAGPAHARSDS